MKNIFAWAYGLSAYLLAFGTLILFALFTVNIALPFSVDSGGVDLGYSPWIINLMLIALFGVQHSVMARPKFKTWLHNYVAEPFERSTYLIASCIPLLLLLAYWQPMTGVIWVSHSSVATLFGYGLAGLGWFLVVLSTFLINHFDLFGLRQVYFYTKGEPCPPISFETPLLYRLVRHPMQLGVVLGVWCSATMTMGHLVLASGMTVYILIGVYFEERDLVNAFGERYRSYQLSVPKLLPWMFPSGSTKN
jgi:protein-S-isoprenylcysteine O-methyltransferase Ste14